MKRDMDFVREFLLAVESGSNNVDTQSKYVAECKGFKDGRGLPNDQAEKLLGHLKILEQAHLISIAEVGHYTDMKRVELTWEGHDFLNAVRDPEIWKRTKAGAQTVGGLTLGLLKDLAIGFAKQKIDAAFGIKL